MSAILTSEECLKCKYCTLDVISKALIKTYCDRKEKTFYYGQCIDCTDFSKREQPLTLDNVSDEHKSETIEDVKEIEEVGEYKDIEGEDDDEYDWLI